jgi:hypothetical protein
VVGALAFSIAAAWPVIDKHPTYWQTFREVYKTTTGTGALQPLHCLVAARAGQQSWLAAVQRSSSPARQAAEAHNAVLPVQGNQSMSVSLCYEDLRPPAPQHTYITDTTHALQFGDPVDVMFMGAWCPASVIEVCGSRQPRVLLHGRHLWALNSALTSTIKVSLPRKQHMHATHSIRVTTQAHALTRA